MDDFNLLTILMGSPVLPPLPFLSFSDQGFDCILYIYKRVLPYLEGYITDGGDIDFARLSMVFKDIGFAEEIMVKNITRLQYYQKKQNSAATVHWKEFINEKKNEFIQQLELSESEDEEAAEITTKVATSVEPVQP